MEKPLFIIICAYTFLISSCTGLADSYLGLFGIDPDVLKKELSYTQDYSGRKDIRSGSRDAGAYLTGKPHPNALNVPADLVSAAKKNPARNLPVLVDHLVKDIDDPFIKVKILHDYTIYNVKYDYKAYYSNRIPDQSYGSVFSRGTAVCAGYSTLFKVMCEMADIRCQVLQGYARAIGYNPGGFDEKAVSNHAWNAVFIEDGWYLLEVTWDSCYLKSPEDYSEEWLFSSPEGFGYSHFPDNKKWQLLEKPLDAKTFLASARMEPAYTRIFGDGRKKPDKFIKADGIAEIILPPADSRYIVSGSYHRIDKKGENTGNTHQRLYIEYGEKETILRAVMNEKGLHAVNLFYAAVDRVDFKKTVTYQQAGEFCIENKKASEKILPNKFDHPPVRGFRLVEPLYGPLTAGENTMIHFFVPDVSEVYIWGHDGVQYKFTPANDKGEFIINYKIPGEPLTKGKSLSIMKKNSPVSSSELLSYQLTEKKSGKKK